MKRMSKKLLAVFLALSVVCTMSGMTALATEGEAYTPVDEADADNAREGSVPAEESVRFDSLAMVSEIEVVSESAGDAAEAIPSGDAVQAAPSEETAKEDPEFLMAVEEFPEDTAGEQAAGADDAAAQTEPDALPESGEAAPAEDAEAEMPPLDDQTLPAAVRSGRVGFTAVLPAGSSLTLSGMMPKGAFVEADPVEVEIEGIAVVAAFDITIRDAAGNEYQPQEGPIRVHIENEAIRNAEIEGRNLRVYHMKDVNAEPEKVPVMMTENGAVEFDADSFSVYVVGEDFTLYETDDETEHYVYTVNFYLGDPDGNALLSSQTVSPGERVWQPSVPDHANYTFAGWYSEPGGGGERYDFYNGTLSEITDGQNHEINLYAHYNEIYYVHFMTHAHVEGDGDTIPVFHIEGLTRDQLLDTDTAERLYLAEGYLSYTDEVTGEQITALAVTGWKDLGGNSWKTGDPIDWDSLDGGPLELYPVVKGACWVYFSMNGQTGVENPAPAYVLASETTIGDLPEPSVSGYSLAGWYTAAEGGEQVTDGTAMESLPKNKDGSVTLYAHWTPGRVAYTINIWRQKAIDGAAGVAAKEIVPGETFDDYIQYYDYAESHYVSAEQSRLYTGDSPTADKVDNWSVYTGYATTRDEESGYYGFEYSADRTLNDLAAKTMAADGSTIINIFYNRVTVTWTFSRSSGQGGSGIQTGTLIGLYDTNVAPADGVGAGTLSDWPSAGANYIWQTSVKPYTFETRFRLLNNAVSSSFTPSHYDNANRPVYYYLEVTNESTQVDPGGEKAAEAAGYGISYTKTVNGTPYVFVRRLMVQGSLDIASKFIGYDYVGYNVTDSGSTFTGTGSSLPTGSGACFLFNNAKSFTATLFSSSKVVGVNNAGEPVETAGETTWTVKYGEDLSQYAFPASLDPVTWGPAYYCSFTGIWYEDPSLTAPFTASTMPNYNLVAYADWELSNITVTFVTGVPDVEAPEAQVIKATSAAADPGTLEREGYTLVGWVDQNGGMFNFNTKLYEDTSLTAIWKSEDETGYPMHYNLNVSNSNGLLDPGDFPDGTDIFTDPQYFTAGDFEELKTIEQAFGSLGEDIYKAFIGWNTAADGSGTMYYPYSEIYIDGEVTLYAVWAHSNKSTLVLVHNYPGGYTGGTADNMLTQANLTTVDVRKESGMAYHDEITFNGSDGAAHTYRFDGWSTARPGSDPTDADVDVAADALVAVDTLETGTGNVNYLYAVWVEVHQITVTKKVVDNAANYTVPEGQTYTFVWSFVDGEGNTFRNEGIVEIGDGESFEIDGVASGERVTVTEEKTEGFSTSYNGAHIAVADDGNGTCTFTMDANSQEITVYNTVETAQLSVEKVWRDGDAGHGNTSVSVIVKEDGAAIGEALTLNAENGWSAVMEVVPDSGKVYTVEECDVPVGYKSEVSGDAGSGFLITNTKLYTPEDDPDPADPDKYGRITVIKVWDDDGDRDGIRPDTIGVSLLANGTAATDADGNPVTLRWTRNGNDFWTAVATNLPGYDADGAKITYTVRETEAGTYSAVYDPAGREGEAVSGVITDGRVTITNTYEPDKFNDGGDPGDPDVPEGVRPGELPVTKVWIDNENALNFRPEKITVRLLANGAVMTDSAGEEMTVTLDASNDWTGRFAGLYKYAGGEKIQYSVEETEVPAYYTASSNVVSGGGIITLHNELSYRFYPLEEMIVPDGDDEAAPDSWVRQESVNGYEPIEIEMSTTLPGLDGRILAEGSLHMTFHNVLDASLIPDGEYSDFTVDINGVPIDRRYFELEVSEFSAKRRLLRLFRVADDCAFHVNINLSALYNDGVIGDGDLDRGTVRVFFYADLETDDVGGSYTSTAWYDVAAGNEVLFTSDTRTVSVYTFGILLDKYDAETEAPLGGASFGLYCDGGCTVAVTRSGENYTVVTDKDGQAMFAGVAEGTYYVRELAAPEGYDLSAEILPVTLSGPAEGEHIVEVSFGNTPAGGEEPGPEEPEGPGEPEKLVDPDNPGGTGQPDDPDNPGGTGQPDDAGKADDTGVCVPAGILVPADIDAGEIPGRPDPGSVEDAGGSGSADDAGNADTVSRTARVKTADTNAPILYLILIVAAGAAVVALGMRRRIAGK